MRVTQDHTEDQVSLCRADCTVFYQHKPMAGNPHFLLWCQSFQTSPIFVMCDASSKAAKGIQETIKLPAGSQEKVWVRLSEKYTIFVQLHKLHNGLRGI